MATKRPPGTIPGLSAQSQQLYNELRRETDRGAALVGAAFLDDVLQAAIRAVFVDDPKVVNELMGMNRPLNSFASRIHLAYCLGLLGPDAYADLHRLRDIRNDFGHHLHVTAFEEQSIKDRCAALRAWKVIPEHEGISARDQFILTTVFLTNRLLVQALSLKHIEARKDPVLVRHLTQEAPSAPPGGE
jgi:DNA-binding MltR family transcriptional regulator